MDLLISAFNTILYRPLLNALVLLYQHLPGHDFGVAVIVLTMAIRVLLYPSMVKSIKSQKALTELQPKIQEIQKKLKDNKEKQAREIMELYRKEKINPLGGLLPLLIQLPILIALYQVFWKGLRPGAMDSLYGFISNPGAINPDFLGLINLGQPSLGLAFLAGIAQFFQSKMLTPQRKHGGGPKDQASQFSDMAQKQMLYFFPVFTVLILWKLPSAIGLYWVVSSLFSIGQQYFIIKTPVNQLKNA